MSISFFGVRFCQAFFVTFFEKKVTPKNFQRKFLWYYILRSTIECTMFANSHFERTMFAPHPI